MNRTKVEWAKNPDGSPGYSWNPITGCLNNCRYCYARKLANGRLKNRFLANTNLASDDGPDHKKHLANPFYPRFWPKRLKELQKSKSRTFGGGKTSVDRHRESKPKGIFACNMCDLFGEWIPDKWKREVFKVVKDNPQHRFYFLTKKPQNVPSFSPFLRRCWIGVTICDNQMATNAWKCYFDMISAKVKFISFEPLFEEILALDQIIIQKADWVVIGSQTKPYHPPKIEWVQSIIERADKAGVPVFLKDNLKPLLGDDLRQEMPVG